MGRFMEFENYDPNFIQEQITSYFDSKYKIKVQYVNLVHDIADFFKVSEKFN